MTLIIHLNFLKILTKFWPPWNSEGMEPRLYIRFLDTRREQFFYQSIPSGNTIGPLTALRFSTPHKSSTRVSANGKAVPGPRLRPADNQHRVWRIGIRSTDLVTKCPETTTLLSLYSKSWRCSEWSIVWETPWKRRTIIQLVLDAGV